MTNARRFAFCSLALGALAGCIVGDEATTITILPDGSADFISLRSNIRSSEPGERGAEELRRHVKELEEHRDETYLRLEKAGATNLESRWLRREEPYASLVVARLPNAAALESFLAMKDEKGEATLKPRFTQDGKRRRLAIEVPVPKDARQSPPGPATLEWLRQEQASGLSAFRFAVAAGRITSARGFAVAEDKRSALLGAAEVRELLRSGQEKVELSIEWELTE